MSRQEKGRDAAMGYELLDVLHSGPRGTISLVFDTQRRRMLVEKRLNGKLDVYRRLQELPHPYLPQLYEVRYEDENAENALWLEITCNTDRSY